MKNITNTAKDDVHNEWLLGRNPKAIEDQEKRGQKELLNSAQLPTEIEKEDKEVLKNLGVVFGEPLPNDPIFCDAKLPDGWKLQVTDHSMWTELLDADNKVIAHIFYKAAFYDRSAFMRIVGE